MKKFAIALLCATSLFNTHVHAHGTLISYGVRLAPQAARVMRTLRRGLATTTGKVKNPAKKSSKFSKGLLAGSALTFGGVVAAERNDIHPTQEVNKQIDKILEFIPYPGV